MPTILLAESGSTKTEWRLFQNGSIIRSFRTEGLNPSTYSEPDFKKLLQSLFDTFVFPWTPDQIIFYGAGLRDDTQKTLLHNQLQSLVPASHVRIEDDLYAAVHATGKPDGIVCILGTGSNACRYQDQKIIERAGGHGYLLGDEGSGMDLGKNLLKCLLQSDFSSDLHQKLVVNLGKTPEVLKKDIYSAARPQFALATLTRHLTGMLDEPEISKMIADRFHLFFNTTVCRFENAHKLTIDFVGSISVYFQPVLQQCLRDQGLQWGKCIQQPIDELVKTYISHDEVQSSR